MELSNQIKSTKTDSNPKPTKFNIGFGDGDRNNNAECELNPITIEDYDYKQSTNRSENPNEKCQLRLNVEQNASIQKQSAIINFSVERILNSSPNKSRICANDLSQTRFEMSSNTKCATVDSEYGKVHRPLPVRYMANNNPPFPGYALNNIPVSLRRCHLKYPYSHYYHHITPARFVGPSFDVEHILTPNPLSFSHLQNPHHRPDCLVDPTNPKITSIPPPSAASSGDNSSGGQVKRKRSWSRAVFSQLQRKGLEIQFQIQKYITKPDRRKLAARLGLTDAQVKVWFQNRRMKWRHTRENKLDKTRNAERKMESTVPADVERDYLSESSIDSGSCSSDEGKHDIDVVTE